MARILETARNRGPVADSAASPAEPVPLGLDIVGRRAAIDERKLSLDRLAKVRAELSKFDYAAALLADPINIRYATGSRNMPVWTLHAPAKESNPQPADAVRHARDRGFRRPSTSNHLFLRGRSVGLSEDSGRLAPRQVRYGLGGDEL